MFLVIACACVGVTFAVLTACAFMAQACVTSGLIPFAVICHDWGRPDCQTSQQNRL